MPVTVYDLELSDTRVVQLRELTAGEFESLFRAEGGKPNADWELTQRGLRMAIVADRGEALTYQQLVGSQLTDRFSVRELLLLRSAFETIHFPDQEERARVKAMRASVSGT